MAAESKIERPPSPEELEAAFHALVQEYRPTCLWFWRKDYAPETREARVQALRYIQTYGDRSGYLRAARLLKWL